MGIFGSVVGGLIQAGSAKSAARSQEAAANRQIDLQEKIYGEQKDLFSPFVSAGRNALDALQYELGLGEAPTFGGQAPEITVLNGGSRFSGGYPTAARPGVDFNTPVALQPPVAGRDRSDRENARVAARTSPQQPQTPANRYMVNGEVFDTRADAKAYANANKTGGTTYGGFKATPGYDFRLSEGINAIDRSAASSGGLFSGATMKAAQQYGEGLAADEYANYYNRLAGMAAGGQSAAGMQGAAAQNYGTGASSALANIGNAQAAGAIGAGNAINSGIGNAVGIWQYQNALNPGASQSAGIFDAPWASGGFWG